MITLVQWLQTYSLPVVLLLVLGAALAFVVKLVVERALDARFGRLAKDIELRLERMSRFQEKVLLDRYLAAGEVFSQIQQVATAVNRYLNGQEVEGLFRGKELAPLTSVYEVLDAKRYLLGDELCRILEELASVVLALANAGTADQQAEAAAR